MVLICIASFQRPSHVKHSRPPAVHAANQRAECRPLISFPHPSPPPPRAACNAFAKNGAPCGDYASVCCGDTVCCGGFGPGGAAACVGERIRQAPVPGRQGHFTVQWTPGTCVAPSAAQTTSSSAAKPGAAKPAAARPYAPPHGSYCTRWVSEGGACTFSGSAAPASGMVCCDPGLARAYKAGDSVSILTCGQKQDARGAWVPTVCQRQQA